MRSLPLRLLIKIVTLVILALAILFIVRGWHSSDEGSGYNQVPKPRGYMRMDIAEAAYTESQLLPVTIAVNDIANVTLPYAATEGGERWLDINYPAFEVKIHCSYIPIDDAVSLWKQLDNRIERVMMNANFIKPTLYEYSNDDGAIKSTLFANKAEGITPIEFIATDSLSFVFSGTLTLYGGVYQDSIAPVVDYIMEDIKHLLVTIH